MPCSHQRGVEEQLYSLVTTVLDGGGCSMPCPDLFTPRRKPQYPLYRRLGGPQSQSAWVWSRENLLCPPEFKP